MRNLALLSICYCIIMLQGCASIICGSTKTVSIKSEPSNIDFAIKDKTGMKVHEGKTPEMVTLKRGGGYFEASDYTVEFTNNTETDQRIIKQNLNAGWYLGGNIIFGGLIGWFIVDPITGAMYDIPDVSANLNFKPAIKIDNGKKLLGYQKTKQDDGTYKTIPVYAD